MYPFKFQNLYSACLLEIEILNLQTKDSLGLMNDLKYIYICHPDFNSFFSSPIYMYVCMLCKLQFFFFLLLFTLLFKLHGHVLGKLRATWATPQTPITIVITFTDAMYAIC